MRSVKITLAAIVLGIILFFILRAIIITTPPPPPVPPPLETQFIERIQKGIESLREVRDNKFSGDFYREISYKINEDYTHNRFGNGVAINEKWKDSLSSQLHSVYAEKFIVQANTVFSGSEWAINDIDFIKSETQMLKVSPYFVGAGSNIKYGIDNIQAILQRYDETMTFITFCNNFSYSNNSLSARYPVSEAREIISQAASFRNWKPYKSAWIKEAVNDVPQIMYQAHLRYLDNKFNSWKGKYSQFSSQSDYANRLYTPLKSEIDDLLNIGGIYNTSSLKSEHQRLLNALNSESNKAYFHFQN